ncbi:transporter substrate-binding domain-containing protein [Pseudomonas sp. LS44]|uniref:transporter substrate-binding domain-containing protein n=1 Tax=Pseudomonas sp. LS44 TaxID=1357074 RepID=UPI00215B4F29|nr:transporter substrate-binding domain-containing protein [Pseudomonas sp. LS44]UVE17295.1 transporter substrate-binding domain-containing protein [Pseudomonas sp. LS44]
MRSWIGTLLCVLGLSLTASVQAHTATGTIRVASEVWSGYTEADGSGLAWDVLRKVFGPAGVELHTRSVPYTRAVGLVKRGEADAWVGSYLNEIDGAVVYPLWHFDADQIYALGRADEAAVNLDNLGDFRLVWMRGYAFAKYLPNLTHFEEIQRRGGILSMLDLEHADFYIDARPEIEQVLQAAKNPAAYRITPLTQLRLYLAFADTPHGRTLAKLFDERMAVLVKSGELRPVFARWHYPYPFVDTPEETPHALP